MLTGLSARTAEKVGAPLDVGDLSDADKSLVNVSGDDVGREPVELLARIIAHIGHRIPFFSKVEKRLEGKDAKSGLAGDVVAFIVQLWHRNRDLAPVVMQQAQQQRAQRAAASASPVTDVPDVTGNGGFPQQEVNR